MSALAIAAGEVLVLVGRSGAGKSTILKLINGLLAPTTGRVSVEGRDTRDWDGIRLRRRIGYVLQDVGLFPHMTVGDNVGVVPRLEDGRSNVAASACTSCSIWSACPPRHSPFDVPRELRAASGNASAWRARWP